jgi:hypothetical protein
MVDLNDSTKVVQVQLSDDFVVKDKQFGIVKGVYNDSQADTAEKGYGRCNLIKGNYYYFTISNNKSGMPLRKGDLLYTFLEQPKVYDGQIVKLASHYIELQNVYEQPFYDRVAVYFEWNETQEKMLIDSAVADVRFTGKYFLVNNPSMNQTITKGTFKGQKVLNVMINCKTSQIKDFFAYMIARPRLYAGRQWKISEIFATWLTEGAPAVVKY